MSESGSFFKMPGQSSFRQTDEKHVAIKVEFMEWSPKMDLLAVANIQGEVILHRLSWQRVWNLPPPTENSKVKAIAWRTDGKVLAVGYMSGEVLLCNVENAAVLHTLQIQGEVYSMQWMCDNITSTAGKKCYKDRSAEYLPKVPALSKSYGSLSKGHSEENVEDLKKLADQVGLNILLIGSHESVVELFAYGVFPVGAVDLKQHKNTKVGSILSLSLSEDLHLLSLIVQSAKAEDQEAQQDVFLLSFESTLLASRYEEVQALAFKYGHVVTLLEHLRAIIKQMSEAWEDILLEMDSKLVKFAEEKYMLGTGTVSNDFLELLLFGTPSDELLSFLLHDLTEKGLKKLGHSIETSYSNIQKLVLKHLQSVTQALVYHLNEIEGMSSWYDKFGLLGLSSASVQEAVQMAGAFMLKAVELQQVIDGSMKNFKAFFRWLYVVIQRLSQEAIPAELNKMTQQDLNFVTDFLKEYFTEEMDGSCKSGFKLEKVGQYLKHEDLQDPLPNTDNPWLKFVNSSQLLQASPLLFKPQTRQSLVQVEDRLRTAINTALTKPSSAIGQSLQCSGMSYLFRYKNIEDKEDRNKLLKPKFTHLTLCDQEAYQYMAFSESSLPSDFLYLIRQKTHAGSDGVNISVVKLKFGCLGSSNGEGNSRCSSHKVLDVTFYNQETLSVLLLEDQIDGLPVLAQVLISSVENDQFTTVQNGHDKSIIMADMQCVDVAPSIDPMHYRRLENMKAHSFAVSGTRHVACVLFSSRRRVRLFLMDAEDDEDEDETDLSLQSTQDLSTLSRDTTEEEDKENTDTSGMEG